MVIPNRGPISFFCRRDNKPYRPAREVNVFTYDSVVDTDRIDSTSYKNVGVNEVLEARRYSGKLSINNTPHRDAFGVAPCLLYAEPETNGAFRSRYAVRVLV